MITDIKDITSFRWATVTGTAPLAIIMDGDTTTLALVPDSLVDPLTLVVYDRVRVELSLRKCVIHGVSRGGGGGVWKTATSTPTSGVGALTSALTTVDYRVRYGICEFQMTVSITTAGTGGGALIATLPFPAVGISTIVGRESSVVGTTVNGSIINGSSSISIFTYANATIIGDGRNVRLSGSYRIA